MSVNACSPVPFVGTQQFEVPFSTTISPLNRVAKGGGFLWTLDIVRRNAIPIYGVKKNSAGTRVTVRFSSGSTVGICTNAQVIVYTPTGVIAPGVTLFDDAAMTIPHTGDDFVLDVNSGLVYNINTITGVVGALDVATCTASAIPVESTFDFLPSTKGNEQTLIDVYASAYAASLAAAINSPINPPETYNPVNNPDYSLYLYNKISNDPNIYNRYIEVVNKAAQFFRLHAAIPTFTIGIYDELTTLISKIMTEADKQMSLPPGHYIFDEGSAAQASLEAWFAADNTLVGLYSIELVLT